MVGAYYIVLSGVHASGKSTILDLLKREDGYLVIPESKDVILTNPTAQPPFQRQHWFMNNVERREYEIEKIKETFICDRWVGDILRYSKVLFEKDLLSLGEYNNILWRYELKDWKIPDLEVVLTADEETLKKRINSRGRDKKQKEGELALALSISEEFKEYANGHKFNRCVNLLDTSSKTIKETYQEVAQIIKEYTKRV